jgi:cytochrome c biogenesis protein CcdA
MAQRQAPRRESILGMVRELVSGSIALGKLEIASAKQEAGQGGTKLKIGGALLGIGFAFGLLTLVALAVLPIAVVAAWLPLWLSALIFLLGYLILTIGLIILGVRWVIGAKESFTIPRTRASVEEDVAWAKRLLRRE